MCGIFGYVGKKRSIKDIINGLKYLEYRGYDSSGIAYFKDNTIVINKAVGKINNLLEKVCLNDKTNLAIAHTRWATHGKVNEVNAHPHVVGSISIVHNGIIENYEELKNSEVPYDYKSETDTEVIAALINKLYESLKDMKKVLKSISSYLVGSYAIGAMVNGDDKLYAMCNGSPLIVGIDKNGYMISSDISGISEFVDEYYILNNEDYCVISEDTIEIYNNGNKVQREIKKISKNMDKVELGNFEHYMIKEIHDQPHVIDNLVKSYLNNKDEFLKMFSEFEKYDMIDIVGCGSAYNAGLVGKYLLSQYTNAIINVEVASEYRYEKHNYLSNSIVILISQSGETADTLAVLRDLNEKNIDNMAIVNVMHSSIAREAKKVVDIKAGIEVSVATTKAYTAQVMIFSMLSMYLGIKKGYLDDKNNNDFKKLPKIIESFLKDDSNERNIAKQIYKDSDVYFIGRKLDYALSLEACLKLKEISYIHGEAYQAGELKHGSISLIDKDVCVISVLTEDDIIPKTISNIKEVCARNAFSVIITDTIIEDKSIYKEIIQIPKVNKLYTGILVIIKLQLLAYYVAKYKGTDIDKPRNLAKSVTVE